MPKALRERPRLYPYNRFYLEAFYSLNNSRQIGMGVGPIPCSEVLAFCQMHGDFDPTERLRLWRLINRMDTVYLAQKNERK